MSSTARASAAGRRRLAVHRPGARREERLRHLERLGLDVLRQRERHRAGLGGIGEHAHRLERCGNELLRTLDTVEEARHGPEAVVDRQRRVVRRLELLEDRMRRAGRERVPWQQEHGQPVDRGQRRPRDHVRRARADGGGAGVGRQPVALARVAGGDVDHRLLVARLVERQQVAVLLQRLADAGDVAVAEDAEAAGEEALAAAVALDLLRRQESDERLGDGEPDHAETPSVRRAARGRRASACRRRTPASSDERPRRVRQPQHPLESVCRAAARARARRRTHRRHRGRSPPRGASPAAPRPAGRRCAPARRPGPA